MWPKIIYMGKEATNLQRQLIHKSNLIAHTNVEHHPSRLLYIYVSSKKHVTLYYVIGSGSTSLLCWLQALAKCKSCGTVTCIVKYGQWRLVWTTLYGQRQVTPITYLLRTNVVHSRLNCPNKECATIMLLPSCRWLIGQSINWLVTGVSATIGNKYLHKHFTQARCNNGDGGHVLGEMTMFWGRP